MAKRYKKCTAGRLVSEIAYSASHPTDPEAVRQAKGKMSSKARQRMNIKAACRRLELSIAANFTLRDLVLTLTYRDCSMPESKTAAVKCLRRFISQLRAHRKLRGQTLKYLYVTESKHGDGRLHHHIVINGTGADLDLVKSLWVYGDDIEMEYIDLHTYQGLAAYLAKEPREDGTTNGRRMWTPSLNLAKPETECGWLDDSVTLEPPPGAIVLEKSSERNEFGEYVYLKYLLPEYRPRRARPSNRKTRQKE